MKLESLISNDELSDRSVCYYRNTEPTQAERPQDAHVPQILAGMLRNKYTTNFIQRWKKRPSGV